MASYLLFQVIYLVVPNQKSSFRQSWPGSVVAAVLLEMYLALFPLYVTRFSGVFFGALSLLILLLFFYYFAVLLFLGAEVNAFVQEVRETPTDLVTMVHMMKRRLPQTGATVSLNSFGELEIVPKGEVYTWQEPFLAQRWYIKQLFKKEKISMSNNCFREGIC